MSGVDPYQFIGWCPECGPVAKHDEDGCCATCGNTVTGPGALQALHLHRLAHSFLETADAAVRHHENKGKGGQQVPFHGDFAHVQPSVASRLRWWAREFRMALGLGEQP